MRAYLTRKTSCADRAFSVGFSLTLGSGLLYCKCKTVAFPARGLNTCVYFFHERCQSKKRECL